MGAQSRPTRADGSTIESTTAPLIDDWYGTVRARLDQPSKTVRRWRNSAKRCLTCRPSSASSSGAAMQEAFAAAGLAGRYEVLRETGPRSRYGCVMATAHLLFFAAVPRTNRVLPAQKNVLTEGWTDVLASEHDHAFMVAGANRMDLLLDLRAAVDKAIATGTGLEEFRADFDAIVAKHGWLG